jgi:hypothetical protein
MTLLYRKSFIKCLYSMRDTDVRAPYWYITRHWFHVDGPMSHAHAAVRDSF